ncbi:YhcN/YlaJ family sporulation lipoprotein [Schinkia sp. CFF1]
MSPKLLFITSILMTWLVGCNISNNTNEGAQPQIGENAGQVKNVSNNEMNTTNVANQYDQPYNHNYNGTYSGTQDATNDIRSAQQVASRASEAAEKISGVKRAVSVVQGMDIVVGIDVNQRGDIQTLEQKVKQVISKNEQGYNVYVTSDPDIKERIRTLFTNLNNVKTSFVTGGVGEIIYDIGQAHAQR